MNANSKQRTRASILRSLSGCLENSFPAVVFLPSLSKKTYPAPFCRKCKCGVKREIKSFWGEKRSEAASAKSTAWQARIRASRYDVASADHTSGRGNTCGIPCCFQNSFPGLLIGLICGCAKNDEGRREGKSRARSVARGSSRSKRRWRRSPDPRVESINLRHGRAHLQLGRLGTENDPCADDNWP